MATSTPPPPAPSDVGTTTATLTRLCHAFINVVNARDFDYQTPEGQLVRAHVAPDFEARLHGTPFTKTFDQQTQYWRELVQESPAFRWELVDLQCEVKEREGKAIIYLQATINELESISMLGCCKSRWRRVEGRWLWGYHVAMNGLKGDGAGGAM